MEVIPAIDLRGAQLVRLEQGDYARETVYDSDPAAVAARWVACGAPRLHVVDLDGAREGRPRHRAVVREIVQRAGSVPVQLGGGLRTERDIEQVLELGIERVILGTVALESPELLRRSAERWPGRVILGLDAREGRVAIRGWLETSDLRTEELLARFSELPLAAVLHTDIQRDGTLSGPNLDATAALARQTQLPVLASGGVRSTEDLIELARTRVIAGAVVGRALYTGAIQLPDALERVRLC